MNDRDYLRSLGFIVGERGRYSKEMKDALENRDTAISEENMTVMRESVGLPPAVQQREAQELYGLTRGGSKVSFVICSRCANHMIWCECNKILAPDNVAVLRGAAKDLAEIHPRMVQLMTTI